MNSLMLLILTLFNDGGLSASGGPLSDNQKGFDTGGLRLALTIDPEQETIRGYAEAVYRIVNPGLATLELELVPSLVVSSVSTEGRALAFERDGVRLLIRLPEPAAAQLKIRIDYGGNPREAVRPPWDGGFNWSRTDGGAPWVGVSCQGLGGKVWFPCKTHPSDKIEGVQLEITVPENLYCAANGLLKNIEPAGTGMRTFYWEHPRAISTYNISINLGEYDVFKQRYLHQGRELPLYFYFLREYQKADRAAGDTRSYQQKKEDIQRLTAEYLAFFEDHYGPFPWETFKVAHADYRGMEHQTINAYGEHFHLDEGYDFLLFHEMGHEWWGNLVSVADWAHFWIHEGICTYATGVYLEETRGVDAANHFFANARLSVHERMPLVAGKDLDSSQVYGNNVYYKGALMLHSLRFLVGRKTLARVLKEFATAPTSRFPHQVETADFIKLASRIAGRDLNWFFQVYAYQAALPELVATEENGRLNLVWIPEGFPMPIEVQLGQGDQAKTLKVPMEQGKGTLTLGEYKTWMVDPQGKVLRK